MGSYRCVLIGCCLLSAWIVATPRIGLAVSDAIEVSAARWAVLAVAYSPDGRWIASGGERTGIVTLWNAADGQRVAQFWAGETDINALAFSPDGRWLAVASLLPTVTVWDVRRAEPHVVLQGHAGPVNSLAFSPDGRLLATGSADGTARLWRMADGAPTATLKCAAVRAVAFSPDGRTLATGAADLALHFWDVGARTEVDSVPGMVVRGLAFSPDGRTLAVAAYDGGVHLLDAVSHRPLAILRRGDEPELAVAFTPGGALFSAGMDGIIKLWDVPQRRLRTTLTGHEDWVTSLAIAPDGQHLASASADWTARLWPMPRHP
ncbi:MAG TPA: WD40 repeat domain-containing protein [bacterium]